MAAGVAAAVVLLIAPRARAQVLPDAPLTFAGGRATVGGDVSATIAPDDPGYFNYTDYDRSLLRLLQIDVAGSLAATDRIAVMGELRVQNVEAPEAFALYVRVRPWKARVFEVLGGRIPPTFGSFARRAYTADNPLIGEPLAYQYLTSLRPDSLPASADELLRMRGRGWLSSFSVGNRTAEHGVPLVSAARYDTGIQLHASTELVDAAVAVTVGTLSHPMVSDDNGGKQVAGRFAVHPFAPLVAGVSFARGRFVSTGAADAARVPADSLTQQAWGADVEYSKDHLLVRFEAIGSAWTMPVLAAPVLDAPLRATSLSIETRYKLRPGAYAAVRFDRLGFSEISGTSTRAPWDAPVRRLEVGGGYLLQRNLVAKLAYQYNWRDGGRVRNLGLLSAQLLFWL